jgi:hypothetical protein
MGQYLKDRKGFKKYDIMDGEKEMTNPFTLQKSLNRDTINNRGWENYLPFLVFEHIITTHQFNPTNYSRTYQDRKVIQDKVWELHNKGWGYTKIHHYLVDNGYEVGKSRTVVDSMIKKRIKRERTLNQPIIIDKFVDFRMEVLRN